MYRVGLKNCFGLGVLIVLFMLSACRQNQKPSSKAKELKDEYYTEKYRPQYHFSPKEKWMNDPNGLVYVDGVYHLFYQHYPDSTVWGPMHWGHAVSSDMLTWQHKPIALYPDEHGFIFSGSAVVDTANTSGFGTLEHPPLVAVFTYHLMEGEQAGKKDFQTQGIAYSLDKGETWTKYEGNPVIKNTGIKDFRDPKVFWNDIANAWTMLLVAGDHLQIWNSDNLKEWKRVSEFGKDKGAHGGVWECPDMFPLTVEGTKEQKWVLLISINPGAPNGGSGTQYFIGDFDGTTFTASHDDTKWLDMGRDNYAGVTYNNTPNKERIFIGWMSNWDYARDTPTEKWRSAMTIPRNVSLHKINGKLQLFNYPIPQFQKLLQDTEQSTLMIKPQEEKKLALAHNNQSQLSFLVSSPTMEMILSNPVGDILKISVNVNEGLVSLDRAASGLVDFKDSFVNGIQKMPISNLPQTAVEIKMLLDQSSLELFINKGQYVMTNQLFPQAPYTHLTIKNKADKNLVLAHFSEQKVKRVWE